MLSYLTTSIKQAPTEVLVVLSPRQEQDSKHSDMAAMSSRLVVACRATNPAYGSKKCSTNRLTVMPGMPYIQPHG